MVINIQAGNQHVGRLGVRWLQAFEWVHKHELLAQTQVTRPLSRQIHEILEKLVTLIFKKVKLYVFSNFNSSTNINKKQTKKVLTLAKPVLFLKYEAL